MNEEDEKSITLLSIRKVLNTNYSLLKTHFFEKSFPLDKIGSHKRKLVSTRYIYLKNVKTIIS